jgi:hypothetical protein
MLFVLQLSKSLFDEVLLMFSKMYIYLNLESSQALLQAC